MINGIGCDIVSIKRIENILAKTPSFITSVYSNDELNTYHERNNDIYYLATRFAAKEAIVKALKEYHDKLNTIEIINTKHGDPIVKINGEVKSNIQVSISYDTDYAIAYAVLLSYN